MRLRINLIYYYCYYYLLDGEVFFPFQSGSFLHFDSVIISALYLCNKFYYLLQFSISMAHSDIIHFCQAGHWLAINIFPAPSSSFANMLSLRLICHKHCRLIDWSWIPHPDYWLVINMAFSSSIGCIDFVWTKKIIWMANIDFVLT